MKRFLSIALLSLFCTGVFAKTERQVAVFAVEIHCQACITKIEKNIGFMKGVKDLRCDKEKQQVTVTFDPQKTSVEQLQTTFAKINKPAKQIEITTKK